MRWCLALDEIRDTDRHQVGAKAFSLAVLQRRGFQVPRSLAVPASAYEVFVEATGLRERILLELNRKEFKEMRWEELWDAGLRIRNLFLTRPLPVDMEASLREAVALDPSRSPSVPHPPRKTPPRPPSPGFTNPSSMYGARTPSLSM